MTQHETAKTAEKKYPAIHITIDSKPFVVHDDDWEARALLMLAGLDPAEYDLAQIKRNGTVKRFNDTHVVKVDEADVFESIKQDGPVA